MAALPASSRPAGGHPQSPLDSQMGRMGEKYTSKTAGTLDCLCHVEVERLKIIPSRVDGWWPPALATEVFCATSSSRGGGSITCPGHSNPLPPELGAPAKKLFLGESHSASVTPRPPPQALPSTTSPAEH